MNINEKDLCRLRDAMAKESLSEALKETGKVIKDIYEENEVVA